MGKQQTKEENQKNEEIEQFSQEELYHISRLRSQKKREQQVEKELEALCKKWNIQIVVDKQSSIEFPVVKIVYL